jgi:hypothetical protein
MLRHRITAAVVLFTFVSVGSVVAAEKNASTALSYSPNPVVLLGGDDVALTSVTTSEVGSASVSQGTITFWYKADGDWTQFSMTPAHPDSDGKVTRSFDLDAVGIEAGQTIRVRAEYETGGGGSTKADTHKSADLPLVVSNACTGFRLAMTRADGPGDPEPGFEGSWTFRVAAKNCTGSNLNNVKIQGGTSGWTDFNGYVESRGKVDIKSNKRNEVLTWTLSLNDGDEATLDVTLDGKITENHVCSTDLNEPVDGSVKDLTGNWSASHKDMTRADAAPVSLTVQCAEEE